MIRGAVPGATQAKRKMEKHEIQECNLGLPETICGDRFASDFWTAHAETLNRAGLLTPQDRESFAVLCKLWSLLSTMELDDPKTIKTYLDVASRFQQLAKQFGMTPASRKSMAVSIGNNVDRYAGNAEFDL
jgi:phage terminase small subunit